MGKFLPNDFGKIVKPKVLLRAYIMCRHDNFDPDLWWRKTRENNRASRTFRRDMISGTYGMDFPKLFSDLPQETFVAQITSFLVVHRGTFKLVHNHDELNHLNTGNRVIVCAVGVKFYKSYDSETKQLGEPWKPTAQGHISWFFSPRQLIPFETIEQYNSAEIGDLVMYSKSHGMVNSIKTMKRHKFWAVCSWTNRKIIVLSGQGARPTKLSVDRPYKLIKKPNEEPAI